MRKRRNIIYAALSIFALVAVGYVLSRPDRIKVETAKALSGPLTVTVDGQGMTRVHDRFSVAAPVNGRLRRITLRRGDEVKAGDAVAEIEALPLAPLDVRQSTDAASRIRIAEAAKMEADANLGRAVAELEQARRDRERSRNLMDYGQVAREDYERKLNAERTLGSDLSAAQTRERAAGQRITQTIANKKEAEAAVERLTNNLQQARRDSKRAADLIEAGVIAREEYEQKRLAEQTISKELEAARYRLEAAESDIELAREGRVEAQENIKHLRDDLAQARREAERAKNVLTYGKTSKQDLEQSLTAERALEKEVEAAQFRLRAAADEVTRAKSALLGDETGTGEVTKVVAPVDGSVLKIIEESERVVTAGAPLLELSNPSNLEVVVDVLSTDAVKIKPGDRATLGGWGENRTAAGRVRLIEPAAFTKVSSLGIEEQRVNLIVDFLERPESLGDGFRVEAKIVVWESGSVLKIPASALFRNGDGWAVFVNDNGRARLRDVEAGHRNPDEAEITGGLSETEEVILHPSNDLGEGSYIATE
ncbi:MAG: HlyD family efflux transporter periplasmic adaptor subunit [Acidobacteria bacterium]|nr:HlyD family efflux transporter periplasmic adaptor subunit [Acidobacteriota bacterium]